MLTAHLAVLCIAADKGGDVQNGVYLPDEQAVKVAASIAKKGDFTTAKNMFLLLLSSPQKDIRIEALFQLGLIHIAEGDFKKAINAFWEIIKNNPALTRVRLELARAYFLNKEYARAEENFRLVLGQKDLPREVARKVNNFLLLIRQQKNWSAELGLAIIPDSNLNYATGQKQECLFLYYGLVCRPLAKKDSGVGLKTNFDGNYYLRFNESWGVRTNLNIAALDFPNKEYDDNSFYLSTGPRYIFKRGEASLSPQISAREYQGEPYNRSFSLRGDMQINLTDRLVLGAGGLLARATYDNQNIDKILRGNSLDLYLYPRYFLNSKSFVMAGLRYNVENTANKSFANSGFGCSLGYYGEFPFGFNLFARADLSKADFKDAQNFIGQSHYIESAKREDILKQIYIRLSNKNFEYKRITPAVSWNYASRNSNIWSYEFEKHRVEFELSYRF
ncbi:MAG: surface lipoprotein assembly modifier [Elusimicrobiota bacterium]|nr:surface lipoprotein assembly modifier [Elusimicrobiota bacterium]